MQNKICLIHHFAGIGDVFFLQYIARKYMEVAARKQSLVCLAADRNTMHGLFELIDEVGPYIAALKTHASQFGLRF